MAGCSHPSRLLTLLSAASLLFNLGIHVSRGWINRAEALWSWMRLVINAWCLTWVMCVCVCVCSIVSHWSEYAHVQDNLSEVGGTKYSSANFLFPQGEQWRIQCEGSDVFSNSIRNLFPGPPPTFRWLDMKGFDWGILWYCSPVGN